MYGLIIGCLFYLNCYADTLTKKAAVFITTVAFSLIFGGIAAKG